MYSKLCACRPLSHSHLVESIPEGRVNHMDKSTGGDVFALCERLGIQVTPSFEFRFGAQRAEVARPVFFGMAHVQRHGGPGRRTVRLQVFLLALPYKVNGPPLARDHRTEFGDKSTPFNSGPVARGMGSRGTA